MSDGTVDEIAAMTGSNLEEKSVEDDGRKAQQQGSSIAKLVQVG